MMAIVAIQRQATRRHIVDTYDVNTPPHIPGQIFDIYRAIPARCTTWRLRVFSRLWNKNRNAWGKTTAHGALFRAYELK